MTDRDDDFEDPTPEEIAASQRLRDALEDPSKDDPAADLARSLRAAWSPDRIAEVDHRALIDDVAEPLEIAAAASLRDALADSAIANRDAELFRAIAAAFDPKPLGDVEHRAIVERALGSARVVPIRPRVVRVAFGAVTAAIAIAASVFFVVRSPEPEAPLARARSTEPLFHEPFGMNPADATTRIDRIALARASDYRDNRFAKWGVR